MPPVLCLRGLAQLSLDRAVGSSFGSIGSIGPMGSACRASQAACFSTSQARLANPSPKKKGMTAAAKKGTKTLNIKKSRKSGSGDAGKPPAIGERKALRKRIVLSNNNALEVSNLQDLDSENAFSPAHQGHVRGIPEESVDALRAVEAFKPKQGWSLFRRPAVLMRNETTQLARLMKQVDDAAGTETKKTVRRIVTGERMSGKSTLLLQGLAMAHLKDWIIINLPDAKDLVNAHTEYHPLHASQPLQYYQETYTANLLSQILKANKNFFEPAQASAPLVTTNPTLPLPLPPKASLKQLVEVGINDAESSWPVFAALWKELTLPGQPPIMLAIDGLSHIMRDSAYLSADLKPIHAHDLTLVRHLVDHLSGTTPLPNGGLVLAATTSSNSPANPALDFSLQVAEAKQFAPDKVPQWNPYRNADQRVMECLRDMEILKVSGLSKDEARAIMEYYAESGLLRAQIDEGFVSEKWSLAGMGNVGELERTTVRMRV